MRALKVRVYGSRLLAFTAEIDTQIDRQIDG